MTEQGANICLTCAAPHLARSESERGVGFLLRQSLNAERVRPGAGCWAGRVHAIGGLFVLLGDEDLWTYAQRRIVRDVPIVSICGRQLDGPLIPLRPHP